MDHIQAAGAVSLSRVLIVHSQSRVPMAGVLPKLGECVMCLNITNSICHALHLLDRTTLFHALM